MLTEDWMMRQVDALARSIAYLVFQKESTGYVPAGAAEDAALDELHRRLLEKVNAGDIGGAEDLLFALVRVTLVRLLCPTNLSFNR